MKNYWKFATITLGIIFIFLLIYSLIPQYYNFGDLEISKKDFYLLSNAIGEEVFQICSIPQNKCVMINELKE